MRPALVACAFACALALASDPAWAQREHTRLTPNRSTEVTEEQASQITLTLTEVDFRPIQIWVRAGGTLDEARSVVTVDVPAAEGARVEVGQRARAFSPDTRSRMHQAFVTRVETKGDRVSIEASLTGRVFETRRHFILEIVTEGKDMLSVPNEALIETEGRRLAYVQEPGGGYTPREVETGIQGERYTQILGGLEAGDQVVSFGSFFIDAEHKLKGS